MHARLYESKDAGTVDSIINSNRGHDVRLDRDRIVLLDGSPNSLLVWRPGGIVHELSTGNSLGQKARANLLVDFGIRDALMGAFKLWEAIFVCDGDDMARYVTELGAVEEEGKRVFTLRLR